MSTVDWGTYRKCPECGAPVGEPCVSMTMGFITEAPSVAPRDRPYQRRKLRDEVAS